MNNKFARVYFPVLALVTAMLVSLACGSSTTEQLSDATQPTATTASSVAENTPVATQKAGPTATTKPTTPPASPTPKPEAIKIGAQGFGQDGRQASFAFIVENPNPGLAIENSQYQIAAYNAEGAVVETDSGYIQLLLPSQKLGIAGTLFLDEGVTVAKIEVQLSEGDAIVSDPIATFTIDSVLYTASQFSSNVTGIITSPYNRDITSLRVSAVVYNSAGEIIGGGLTYLNFILQNGTTGVRVPVTSAKDVATVELYPAISGLSLLTSDNTLPSGATDLVLSKQGFGQDDNQAGFGMLIENPNEGFSIENTQYHLTAYAENGDVVAVEEGYVNVLLPKQTLGVGGSIFLEKGVTIARLDFQIKAGDFEKSDVLPFFTAENATYQAGQFSSKVTGQIISPYTKAITNVRVSAIAYNEAGDIIGGGYTFLDFVPANGKAAIEVSVSTSDKPATVELYATVSSISDYK